jgi:hypothetical protein
VRRCGEAGTVAGGRGCRRAKKAQVHVQADRWRGTEVCRCMSMDDVEEVLLDYRLGPHLGDRPPVGLHTVGVDDQGLLRAVRQWGGWWGWGTHSLKGMPVVWEVVGWLGATGSSHPQRQASDVLTLPPPMSI